MGDTDIVGNNLSWDDAREMLNSGISFGSHTMTHPALTRISLEKAQMEIFNSKKIIEQEIGEEVKAFSYPHGIYSKATKNLVKDGGYSCAFTINN